jgi:arsenate reductase
LDRAALEGLVRMLDGPPGELVRKDKRFKELGLDVAAYATSDAVVRLLVEHRELMQRPVVVRGGRAVIARPAEKVLEFLGIA